MSKPRKHKKKQRKQKVYKGEDAKVEQPTIHRYSAVERSKFGQWWYERKKIIKPVAIYGGGGIAFIILIIFGLISVF